jgi:hypothetical protein
MNRRDGIMKNFNELTQEEMLEVNGGFSLGDLDALYEFAKGAFKGFRDTAKKMPHTWE